ncbi:glycoside hydrolase family 2 TIM barrel-domain containing protein [Rhizobium helianthi]|uniref:Glycoside hydrolase family 2 TIM barrel-domain containing protein n=1 Tax=Rhizobium helianthi TaxID=1132695 RepID=A0ABW4M2J0_9HYPH
MRIIENFGGNWTFLAGFKESWIGQEQEGETVRLPHTAVELPYNYLDEKAYQAEFTYQKHLDWRPDFEGQEVSLVFDGAMADARVFLNGELVGAHRDGYTPFEARLTPFLRRGRNLLTVRIDGRENPAIPPFGGVIDYLTYAGLYRDVWLRVTAPVFLRNAKIETPNVLSERKSLTAEVTLSNAQNLPVQGQLRAKLLDCGGEPIATAQLEVNGTEARIEMIDLDDIRLWDLDNPTLYSLHLTLETTCGTDEWQTRFGFRSVEFTPEGFRLNGQTVKLRGLNRHQSWPHIGYAMGKRGQEKDAEILKHELRCNVVRTSHYPQSPYFLDRCDEIGLLVFEEIPGWQHIGGAAWKEESVENVRRMIERDWNHPSIIIWGVRINESQDDHDFYSRTNALARELDRTRPTGGVRYITDSELLEDVYTMNDFILGMEEMPGHNRERIVLRNQQEVTGLCKTVPYLITEYGGHMYPTKRFDQEQRQAEHVTRHLMILNEAAGTSSTAGCIGWCMFDYNTHKDFGSGDRICYHGVLDIHREPKFAAAAYASQGDPSGGIVLQPVTFWARGERNIGGVLPLIILTNCDYVEIKIGSVTKRIDPDRKTYPHLPHPPCVLNRDMVTAEEFGEWGMTWGDGEITGFVDGRPVKTLRVLANPLPTSLQIEADATNLAAAAKDTVRVVLRALDQAGNVLPFFMEAVELSLEGPGRLLGPRIVSFKGGVIATYVEAGEGPGELRLTARSEQMGEASLNFSIN